MEVARGATRQPTAPWTAYMALASALGHAGGTREGAAAMEALRGLKPDFNVEDMRRTLVFKNSADLERIIEGVRKVDSDI